MNNFEYEYLYFVIKAIRPIEHKINTHMYCINLKDARLKEDNNHVSGKQETHKCNLQKALTDKQHSY